MEPRRASAARASASPSLWAAGSRAEELLHRARQATFAILPASGPHATPLAVAWHGGRLWAATPRRSLKARCLRGGSPAAALVEDGRGAITVGGTASLVDLVRPSPQVLPLLLPMGFAAARYLSLHARDAVRIAHEAIAELLWRLDAGGLAPRALIALRPDWALVFEDGEAMGRWGAAPSVTAVARPALPARQPAELRSLPRAARDLLRDRTHAALTVAAGAQPMVLPCAWDGPNATVTLPPGAHGLLPRARGPIPASVTIATDEGGLMGKSGVLLRGSLAPARAGALTHALRTDRAVSWRGHAATQAQAAPPPPRKLRHAD